MFEFFFFQAEDGIRDRNVTGVQTCALPILNRRPIIPPTVDPAFSLSILTRPKYRSSTGTRFLLRTGVSLYKNRSEERRVGKVRTTRLCMSKQITNIMKNLPSMLQHGVIQIR